MFQQFRVLTDKARRRGQRLQDVVLFDEAGAPLSVGGAHGLGIVTAQVSMIDIDGDPIPAGDPGVSKVFSESDVWIDGDPGWAPTYDPTDGFTLENGLYRVDFSVWATADGAGTFTGKFYGIIDCNAITEGRQAYAVGGTYPQPAMTHTVWHVLITDDNPKWIKARVFNNEAFAVQSAYAEMQVTRIAIG